jgi:hypothetical protein
MEWFVVTYGEGKQTHRNKKRTITLHVMDCDGIGELEWEL